MITPIFKTDGSLGRCNLTSVAETEIKEEYPVSIFAIAAKHKLNKLVVIEDSFLAFPSLYKNCNKNNIQLQFGINFTLCNNVQDKDEKSRKTEHKISVLAKNSRGYTDLIKLHDAINAQVNNFYYIPRGDDKILRDYWTENLELMIPPFDNFIHKNYLENGQCLPNFGKISPLYTFANMGLPWNTILNDKIRTFCRHDGYSLNEVHPVYYYKQADFKAYTIFRCIDNRAKFVNPNMDYFCSDKFSYEEYSKKMEAK